VKRALVILALAANGCDDAPAQENPDVREDMDAAGIDDAGDASPPILVDAIIDASSIDASTSDAALDGGYVAEVDSGPLVGDAAALPYARSVVSFIPGSNAGFGQNMFPGVVLGPPMGKGNNAGGLDALSLGVGGQIILDFGTNNILDGSGPDFIVFENPFYAGGQSQAAVFAELAEVSVSHDQVNWQTFPCSVQPSEPGVYPGCAGWNPVQPYSPFTVVPLDPAVTGGDAFDLAAVSATSARYVRIRDLSAGGQGMTAGFDLDAVGIIHSSTVP
jgi:hypothetical protein